MSRIFREERSGEIECRPGRQPPARQLTRARSDSNSRLMAQVSTRDAALPAGRNSIVGRLGVQTDQGVNTGQHEWQTRGAKRRSGSAFPHECPLAAQRQSARRQLNSTLSSEEMPIGMPVCTSPRARTAIRRMSRRRRGRARSPYSQQRQSHHDRRDPRGFTHRARNRSESGDEADGNSSYLTEKRHDNNGDVVAGATA